MRFLKTVFASAVILASASCAAAPSEDFVWTPNKPAFGQDQYVQQQVFCGILYEGFLSFAESQEDAVIFGALRDTTVHNIVEAGATPTDENVKKALAFSNNYLATVTDDQLTKDADFCTDVVMITNRDE